MRAAAGFLAAIWVAMFMGAATPALAETRLQGAGATFPDLIYQRHGLLNIRNCIPT